ncbi:MAG: preprotein translocase subunit YajC [Planctomycetota bacterium]
MSLMSSVMVSVGAVATGQPEGNPSNQSVGGPAVQPAASPELKAVTGTPASTPTTTPAQPPSIMPIVLMVGGFFIIMMYMNSRSEKKRQREKQALIDAIGKGDLVQTLGGEIGTVAEIRDTGIVLRFDEGRVLYTKAAIVAVLKSAKSKESTLVESKVDSREGAGV